MGRSDFVDWLDGGAGPFWIYGIPGGYHLDLILKYIFSSHSQDVVRL
jgi:hypothetical protein